MSLTLFIIFSDSIVLLGCGYNSAVFSWPEGICSVGFIVSSEYVILLPNFHRANTDPKKRNNDDVESAF